MMFKFTSTLFLLSIFLSAICSFAIPVISQHGRFTDRGLEAPPNHFAEIYARPTVRSVEEDGVLLIRDDDEVELWARGKGERHAILDMPVQKDLTTSPVPSPTRDVEETAPRKAGAHQSLEKRNKVKDFFKKVGHGIKTGLQKAGNWLKHNWTTVVGVATKFI